MSTDVSSRDNKVRNGSKPGRVEHFSGRPSGRRGGRRRGPRCRVRAHAAWEPPPRRPSPVELLEEQAQTRVPELVPIRYGRMLVSPFTFYRGAAYLMASDLSGMPRTGLHAQLCGDAHLSNFGGFAAPDRRLVFSINDFDETLPGPFEWDVKRLVASFAVAGRDRGFDDKQREAVNLAVGRGLPRGDGRLRRHGQPRALVHARRRRGAVRASCSSGEREGAQAGRAEPGQDALKDSLKAFAKLTEIVDGEPRIVGDPPVVTPIEEIVGEERLHELEDFLRGVIRSYRRTLPGDRRRLLERYRYVHAARKVVGVGSVGTRAYIMLLLGRDDSDPLFLQFKEAEASVLEPFLGKSEFANHGQRVVEGQRLTQAASDIMLGWIRAGRHRRRQARLLHPPALGREGLGPGRADEPEAACAIYASVCGAELARAHARSGDAIAIASYLGTATPSTARSPCSPSRTQTRTNATTRR